MVEAGVGERRILIVEDNEAIARLLAELLTDEGHHVLWTASGAEALELLGTWAPHLILLDIALAEMDGDTFREAQLAMTPPASTVPVVLVTGAGDPEQLAEQLGAVGLVRKPFELDDVLDVVEAALNSHLERR
ncbi:MAG: response regulator [Dehalococcoidia bacterium]|nr:response regulator [Dehalococcoidia bacterium]